MSDDILIRPAAESDLPDITSIYAHAVETGTASFELVPPDLDEMKTRWLTLTGKGYPYLVAERSGKVIGYAYAGPYRPRPAYRHTVESTVYVSVDARRTGIGRKLMLRIIDICEETGFRQMIAIVGDGSNQKASIGLHKALGFREVGTVVASGFKFGRWLDTLTMQRALGEGNSSPPSMA